jgi:hypothetical protein
MSTPAIVNYIRSLKAVRERSQKVYDLAAQGKLDHWDWDESKLAVVADYCAKMIEVWLH